MSNTKAAAVVLSPEALVAEAKAFIAEVKAREGRSYRHIIMYDVKALFRHCITRGSVPATLAVGQLDDLVFEHIDEDKRVGSFRIWRNRDDSTVSMEVLVEGAWELHECD